MTDIITRYFTTVNFIKVGIVISVYLIVLCCDLIYHYKVNKILEDDSDFLNE